jgi:hypothetical protein
MSAVEKQRNRLHLPPILMCESPNAAHHANLRGEALDEEKAVEYHFPAKIGSYLRKKIKSSITSSAT